VAGFGCVADDFVEYLVSLYGNRGKPFSSKKKVCSWNPKIAGVAVYSSETRGWVYKEKTWNADVRLVDHRLAFVFLDGYLHFQADHRGLGRRVAVVDTKGETWMQFGVPDGLSNGFIQHSQGRLHYGSIQSNENGTISRLQVYVLENYESKKWILKHSVDASCLLGGVDHCLYRDIHPSMDGGFDWVAIHPECNLIFFTIGREYKLMCYSMDRHQKAKMISKLVDGRPPYLPYLPTYAELQSLPLHAELQSLPLHAELQSLQI
jgi:hypothetical protein